MKEKQLGSHFFLDHPRMSDITTCNKSMNHQWFTHLATLLIDGHDYYVYIWQNIDVNTQKKPTISK